MSYSLMNQVANAKSLNISGNSLPAGTRPPFELSEETTKMLNTAGLTGNAKSPARPNTDGMTAVSSPDDSAEDIVVSAPRKAPALVDDRLRLSALPGRGDKVYGPKDRSSNILTPLYETSGLLFPYTPSVQVSGEAMWTSHELTHTNNDTLSYQRTPSATISITGKFTVQNQREGEYALAAIHFLRTVTKMYYGDRDSAQSDPSNKDTTNSNAGLPPPVLMLRGFGTYMFNDLHCVVKSFNFAYEENMDLVTIRSPVDGGVGTVLLPALFNISVTVGLQQNPAILRSEFYLDDFRTGKLIRAGGWF